MTLGESCNNLRAQSRLNHLSRFLDNVTTDIMHYEEKKVCAQLIPPFHEIYGQYSLYTTVETFQNLLKSIPRPNRIIL